MSELVSNLFQNFPYITWPLVVIVLVVILYMLRTQGGKLWGVEIHPPKAAERQVIFQLLPLDTPVKQTDTMIREKSNPKGDINKALYSSSRYLNKPFYDPLNLDK